MSETDGSIVELVTKTEEGAYTHLRINFVAPGSTIASQQQLRT